MRQRTAVVARRAVLLLLALLPVQSGGCGEEVVVVAPLIVDAEVAWTINGVDSAALCATFGIDAWLVEVRGPEARDVLVDCFDRAWTTGTALFGLLEGLYTIDVVAFDPGGFELAGLTTEVDLFNRGFIEVIVLDFLPADFVVF